MKFSKPKVIKAKLFRDSRGSLQEIFKDKFKKFNCKFSLLVKSKKRF